MLKNTLLFWLLLPFIGTSQVVINELDSDTPSTDDKEFIELKSDVPNFSLDGYVLVFFNGATNSNKSYFTIDLDGVVTDVNGIALIGNELVSPVPDKLFATSIIQNGPDAVGLYLGNPSDFPNDTLATTANLISALAYDTSDIDATALMTLLGLTVQYNEDENGQGTTQSVQRKPDGTYETKNPTPGANNDGSGVLFNGVTISVNPTAYEIAEGASFTITFTTQTAVTSNLTFNFTLVGTNFNLSDFTGTTTVTIPTGATTFSTSITITDDSQNEGDEIFRIRFGTLPTGYNRLNDNISKIVIDNDFTVGTWGTPVNPTYGVIAPTTPAGYYASLEGKAGDVLKQAIQDIIANPAVVHAQNYGDVTDILTIADQNPLNSNQVWLMYVEQGRGKYKFQSTASNVGSWNREHIFPQSRGSFMDGTSSTPDGINVWLPTSADDLLAGHADAHHIRAEDGPENTLRSNRDYGSDYNGPAGNAGSWKGDVARSLFYMAVRYNGLNLVDGNPTDTAGNKIMGDLASLLTWNHSDPRDDFEMRRNNIVYEWQVNRNPFIDYPDLADYIWGIHAGEQWFSSLSSGQFEVEKVVIYPNPTTDSIAVSGNSNGTIEIFNVSGQKVLETVYEPNREIRLQLTSGLYLAKITSEGKSTVKKLMVK
ncbi:MAG: T9SS type A sorting domain-containing protein [Flavobacterium sp.]|uniref:endonuclease n=1 Tax=Flavobacterium sp. TaxID=239 RepID=UPI0012259C82|nr:endonuclease [Flavobacterium sp.]RZJ66154.1 MAG: T9SS type A sorting domain-containing protein [Flavobacterium sp.]